MSFNLKHYQQFQSILADYTASQRAMDALDGLTLILLLAATSTGRNTIIRHLVATGRYHYVISDTTRPPRVNDGVMEQSGVEYWFRTEEEMLAELRAGEFLEAELIHRQQVSGISIRELKKAKHEQKIAITDVDLKGLHNVVAADVSVIPILFLPPSYQEWQSRITRRGKMSATEYSRRLETAYKIFEDGTQQKYYKYVIAEDVAQSAKIIDAIAAGETNPHQKRGKELAGVLLKRLASELKK